MDMNLISLRTFKVEPCLISKYDLLQFSKFYPKGF